MQQLNAHDAMFVHFDNEDWAAHGGIVANYDPSTAPGGQVRYPDILAHLDRRLCRSPIFRRRLVRVVDLDHPYWIEDEHFDLEFHVRHIRLPEPADWRQLCITVARLDSRPLDLSRPLWEMYMIEGLDNVPGVPAGSYAIFTKLHHAAVDGHSMRDIVSGIHDLTPDLEDSRSGDDWAPEHRPGSATLLGPRSGEQPGARPVPHRTRRPQAAAIGRGVRTSVDRPPSGRRRFARAPAGDAQPLPGRAHSAPGHGRMRVLTGRRQADARARRRRDGQRRDRRDCRRRCAPIPASQEPDPDRRSGLGAPVDLRKGEDSMGGNDIAFLAISLGADVADPVERLRVVRRRQADAAGRGCARAVGTQRKLPGRAELVGLQDTRLDVNAFGNRRPLFNVGVSNVPGPQAPLYMNGARAQRFFGVAPIFDGTALVFGVFSYRGAIEVTS